MNWFRFYHEALNDPKVQRLPGDVFKAWVNLLCLSSQQPERGSLPTVEDCAFALRCDVVAMADVMQQLANVGLLEREPGGYAIHNWDGRQRSSDDVTKRVQKHRAKASEDETLQGNEDETLPKRFSNALDKSREETEKSANAPARANGVVYPPGFIRFWNAYPRKVSKDDAFKAWKQLRPMPSDLDEMVRAIAQQKQSDEWREEGGRYIPHPGKWLRAGRWKDEGIEVLEQRRRLAPA